MDATDAAFAEIWRRADRIEGWLTREQAAVLFTAAASVRPGSTAVEIGSHQGRSTVVLAGGLPTDATLLAIDPFDPEWRYGGPDTRRRLLAHLASSGLAGKVTVLTETSRTARASYAGRVALLYIDGKHDYWTVRDDLRWADLVDDDGTVLVHDAFSSVGVTLALLRSLPTSHDLTYLGRVGSLARLRRGRPTPGQRLRVLAELPWWSRNVVVKVALRLRVRWAARLLGHRIAEDPF